MDVSKTGLVADLAAYAMYRKKVKERLPSLGDKELEELADALVKEQQRDVKASPAKAKHVAAPKAVVPKNKRVAPAKASPAPNKKAVPVKTAPAKAKTKTPKQGALPPVKIVAKNGETMETPAAIRAALASGPKTVGEIMKFFQDKGFKLSRKVFDDAQHVRQVLRRHDDVFAIDASDKTQFRYGLADASKAPAKKIAKAKASAKVSEPAKPETQSGS